MVLIECSINPLSNGLDVVWYVAASFKILPLFLNPLLSQLDRDNKGNPVSRFMSMQLLDEVPEEGMYKKYQYSKYNGH